MLLDCPIAISPCSSTATAVAIEAIDSAIDDVHAAVDEPDGLLDLIAHSHAREHLACLSISSSSRPYRRSKPRIALAICSTLGVGIAAPR